MQNSQDNKVYLSTPFSMSDISAECAVLSAAADKKEWLEEVLNEARIEDFTRAETRAVFSVMRDLYEANKPFDAVSLCSTYRKKLDDAGYSQGRELTFSNVLMSPPMQKEFPSFLARLKEASAKRAAFRAADKALKMIKSGETAAAAYEVMEKAVIDRDNLMSIRNLLTPADLQRVTFDAVLSRADEKERRKRVLYTQFLTINNATGGLDKGDLIILSAQSGAGKSAFSMNIAYGAAYVDGRATAYLNSEMSEEQIGLRLASYITKSSHSAFRNGTASTEEMMNVTKSLEMIGKSKLYVLNIPDMQVQSVLAEVRRMKARFDVELVIVDYIGRMDTMNSKNDVKEWQIMKSAAQRLKTLAEELHVTIIMVAQLTEDGGRLAQSSYMKHEADLWVNLTRLSEEDEKKNWPWNCILTVKKARNVEDGKRIPMRFNGDTLTFTDRRKDAEEMAGKKPASAELLQGAKWQKGGIPV